MQGPQPYYRFPLLLEDIHRRYGLGFVPISLTTRKFCDPKFAIANIRRSTSTDFAIRVTLIADNCGRLNPPKSNNYHTKEAALSSAKNDA